MTTTERSLGRPGRVALLAALAGCLLLAREDPFSVFFVLCYAAIGAVLAIRRPRNAIGWLLVAIAYGFAGTTTELHVDVPSLQDGSASWATFLTVWASTWSGYALFGGFVALALLFPSGQLPRGRWRRPAMLLLTACVVILVLAATGPLIGAPNGADDAVPVPNRLAILPDLAAWSLVPFDLLIVPTVVFLAAAVISMLVRYRRAIGTERQQLKWLVASFAFMVFAIVVGLGTLAILGNRIGALVWIPAIIAYPMIPAAIYVAITRHRLFEIDRIVSRTVGWAVVSVVLAAVFAVAIVGLQAILAPVTDNNTLAVAASTLLAASLFQPLRGQVQRAVDRRFDRSRYDREQLLARFGERLRDEVDLPTISRDARSTVDAAVLPTTIGVWLRRGSGEAP